MAKVIFLIALFVILAVAVAFIWVTPPPYRGTVNLETQEQLQAFREYITQPEVSVNQLKTKVIGPVTVIDYNLNTGLPFPWSDRPDHSNQATVTVLLTVAGCILAFMIINI